MTDDEPHRKSFEEVAREIADELRRSIDRASQTDPEELVRAAGVDPDRVREWVDTAGEWLVRLDAEGIHLTREHAKGDVAVRGPASDVLLVLMGRKTMAATDVFGEAPLFERFRKHASFG